uniref:Uncharacterized protein n=1 Tax=Brassica oleracea var. oleracea TaxID=109376 RepID=A0A0D3ECR5_BRAOL
MNPAMMNREEKQSSEESDETGFPASRITPLGPARQRSTSPGRALPGLDRTQYRFGVQKRQGSFRMERESNPDGGCHHRPVLPL